MTKKSKIFLYLVVLSPIFLLLIYYFMGQIAWEMLKIKDNPPLNAWWILFTHPTSNTANNVAIFVLLSPFIILGFFVVVMILARINHSRRWVYGKAKIATSSDIKRAGLFFPKNPKPGIFLGYFKNKPLYDTGDEHVSLVAPNRSGKGVSILVTVLLTWSDSLLAHDPKDELRKLTSKFRENSGHKVYCFNPFNPDGKTHRFNPFDYVDSKNPINFIQQISYFLYPTPQNGDPIWTSGARTVFQGLCLYVLEKKGKQDLNFSNILYLAQSSDLSEFLLKEVKLSKTGNSDVKLSSSCTSLLEDFAGTTEKTRSGILKQFLSALDIFQNPLVAAATNFSDFDLRKLRKEKTTIYISGGTGVSDLQRMAFLNRLIFQISTMVNTTELPEENPKELKYKCLLVLDEMFHMGSMKELVDSATLIAGYGIRFLTVWQDEAQIKQLYGADVAKTFINNHRTQISFLPDDQYLPDLCSKIGYTTKKVYSGVVGKKQYSLQKRELYTSDELKKYLGTKKSVIFHRGCYPIIAKKAVYYNDKSFLLRIVPEHLINKALNSKSYDKLKLLIEPATELPIQLLDHHNEDLRSEKTSKSINSISKPEGTNHQDMDDFIKNHANHFF